MIRQFKGMNPFIHKDAYISESVDIIGDVQIGENSNIWFGARLRADINKIIIGYNTNIQENVVVHVASKSSVDIGNNVTIGHNAVIHGCKIHDNVLIGMGAIILNDAVISKNSIVGAGSLVTERKEFPEGVLILGSPAKVVRKLSQDEIVDIIKSAENYVALSNEYKVQEEI